MQSVKTRTPDVDVESVDATDDVELEGSLLTDVSLPPSDDGASEVEPELEPAVAPAPTKPRRPPPDALSQFVVFVGEAIFTVLVSFWKGLHWFVGLVTDVVIGGPMLCALLALGLVTPVVNLATYGYILDVTGGIGRTGKLRWGFRHLRGAKRAFTGLLGTAASLGPAYFVWTLYVDAGVLEPGRGRFLLLLGAFALAVVGLAHVALTVARKQGRLLSFLRPLWNVIWLGMRIWKKGLRAGVLDPIADTARAGWSFFEDNLWLGLRGWVATFLWLLPVAVLMAGASISPGFLALGTILLVPVALILPIAQARLAAEDRFSAAFEPIELARTYGKAPLLFVLSIAWILLAALPMYLFKVEALPHVAFVALIAGFFVAMILPSKLLAGWALARASRRETQAPFFFRFIVPCGLAPVIMFYVFTVAFSPLIVWPGTSGLIDHHAFLLPVPY